VDLLDLAHRQALVDRPASLVAEDLLVLVADRGRTTNDHDETSLENLALDDRTRRVPIPNVSGDTLEKDQTHVRHVVRERVSLNNITNSDCEEHRQGGIPSSKVY
jgi:hypothetical protein